MNFFGDVRYGTRVLLKSPGFALTAILTLGLGIGTTTAVYSSSDALLWKPVPLPHMETLVSVLGRVPGDASDWNDLTPADLDDIRRQTASLDSIAAYQEKMANILGGGGEPERVFRGQVAANFFEVLGVQPALGRAFQPGEDQPGRGRVVILSDKLWRMRFGADPGLIGKTIRLEGQDHVVVGIMPPSFDFPVAMELWTPLALKPADRASRTDRMLTTVARLKPGRRLEEADAELGTIGARLARLYPDTNRNRAFMVWPAYRLIVDQHTEQYLKMLLGAVLFVLLIACANIANLQFARGTGRLREVAVRTALGAGRGRVVVQLVTESVLLSLAGAAFGLAIARWGIALIRNNMPPEIQRFVPGWNNIQLDGRALLFTLAAALAAGILSGLAPAWQCSRPNLMATLKEGGRGSSSGSSRRRLRNVLVAGEIALAVVLLVGAGLMVRGFGSMVEKGEHLDPGAVLTLRLALAGEKYQEPHQIYGFYRGALDRLTSLPGVRWAAVVSAMPYSNHSSGRAVTIEGQPREQGDRPGVMYQVASPSYFETMRVPLLAGRLLAESDGPDAPKVAVVGDGMARYWWPDASPLGKRIRVEDSGPDEPWRTIVGVVGDLPHNPYDRQPRRVLYLPFQQAPARSMDVGLRTAGDPLQLGPAVTAAIRSLDAQLPVTDMMTLRKAIRNRAIGLNYMAWMMGVFGSLALVLSAIGVYGVMAYLVTEQTQEIGLRMALGAERRGVLAMVFRRGMGTIAAGLAVGLPSAYGLARLMAALVFGVPVGDPPSFVGVSLLLVAASAVAIYIPARRAMRIDPIVALRYE